MKHIIHFGQLLKTQLQNNNIIRYYKDKTDFDYELRVLQAVKNTSYPHLIKANLQNLTITIQDNNDSKNKQVIKNYIQIHSAYVIKHFRIQKKGTQKKKELFSY